MQSQSKTGGQLALSYLAFPNMELAEAAQLMSRLTKEWRPTRSRLLKFEYVPGEEAHLGRSSTLYCYLELALANGSMDEEERLGIQRIIAGHEYISWRLNDIDGYERYGRRD